MRSNQDMTPLHEAITSTALTGSAEAAPGAAGNVIATSVAWSSFPEGDSAIVENGGKGVSFPGGEVAAPAKPDQATAHGASRAVQDSDRQGKEVAIRDIAVGTMTPSSLLSSPLPPPPLSSTMLRSDNPSAEKHEARNDDYPPAICTSTDNVTATRRLDEQQQGNNKPAAGSSTITAVTAADGDPSSSSGVASSAFAFTAAGAATAADDVRTSTPLESGSIQKANAALVTAGAEGGVAAVGSNICSTSGSGDSGGRASTTRRGSYSSRGETRRGSLGGGKRGGARLGGEAGAGGGAVLCNASTGMAVLCLDAYLGKDGEKVKRWRSAKVRVNFLKSTAIV